MNKNPRGVFLSGVFLFPKFRPERYPALLLSRVEGVKKFSYTPSPLMGEGWGEGEELRNSFSLFIPLPFIVRLSSRRSPLPPGEGSYVPSKFFIASGRVGVM